MTEIFNVELADKIQNVKFSPDVRFFATQSYTHARILMIWDFEAIKAFP